MTDTTNTTPAADAVSEQARSWVLRQLDRVLADNWQKAWKWLSMYGYAAVVASPELYDLLTELINGLTAGDAAGAALPPVFVKLIRTIGVVGMVLRLARQSKKVVEAALPAERT